MRSQLSPVFSPRSFILLVLFAVAFAHGDDGDMKMDLGHSPKPSSPPPANAAPETYFQYGEHSGLMVAHIFLMAIAWVFILPIGVMFSISASRYTLPVQFSFLIMNAVAVVFSTIYNASTPDLYPNNAHHKIGWLLTWIMAAQVAMGVISAYTKKKDSHDFIPVSQEAMAEHQRLHDLRRIDSYRFSNDSGFETEANTESVRSNSNSGDESPASPISPTSRNELEEEEEKQGLMQGSAVDRFLSNKVPGLLSSKLVRILRFAYNAIDRLILILGFVALTTGMVTYGGLFKGDAVFSGLAHWIKGGIFFWYGILSLGRWAGCLSEVGWAWNVKARGTPNRPSAEFVESFLIFFYGSTNVFLEHLAAWGKEWSAQDLEHVSLTIMFFGGGLCGMLIESKRIRNLLNTKSQTNFSQLEYTADKEVLEEPKSYGFSMNPLPALVILLLGLMMSSHHQESMVSTMIHTQWGTLLVGAAFARAATYILFYISPPTSVLPSRPPTELITAFCLMAGGLIFMSSARETVETMEMHGLDAMFIFVVSMGVITFLMAWIIVVIAMKGWAVRKENRSLGFRDMA